MMYGAEREKDIKFERKRERYKIKTGLESEAFRQES